MKPSQPLEAEHEAILVMLEILARICDRLERREAVPKAHLPQILEFFHIFADKCHHAKEEEFLFPAYQSAGIPNEGGPIGVMLSEHQMGREAIAGMRRGLSSLGQEDSSSGQEFVSYARSYIQLLTAHIHKENQILFPMGDVALSVSRQEEIMKEFDRLEETRIGLGKHEEFHRLIETLEAEYL